jgi:hypothetical protein
MKTSVCSLLVCGPVHKKRGKRSSYTMSFFPLSSNTTPLAPELMYQLPICAAHNVSRYRRVRGRNGILCRVRSLAVCAQPTRLSVSHLRNHRDSQTPPPPLLSLQVEGSLIRTGDPSAGRSGAALSNGQSLARSGKEEKTSIPSVIFLRRRPLISVYMTVRDTR